MADPYVRQARGVVRGTAGSTALTAGTPVYFDGTDWEKADATDNTKYAEGIAINSVAAGEDLGIARSCVIVDTDAPYTQGDQYFLSATAGAITATRPTGANNLKQVLGFGVSTSELYVDIPPVKERTYYVIPAGGTDVGVIFQLDSGNYIGHTTNAQNEVVGGTFQVPENSVGLEIAYHWLAAEATGGTPTFDLFVSGAIDGEQWDATTQDSTIADSADEGAAADEIQRTTVTTGFDAAGVWEAGNLLGIRKLKKDSGTDVTFAFGFTLVSLEV